MESLLKADDKKLNEYLLLSNGTFNIPYTQRPYEWNKAQVERLFGDIIAIYEGKKEQHILNFITIYLEEDHQNIFDGQQRTVTLLLFICAMIHKIDSLGKKVPASKLKEEFIKKDDWRSNSAKNTKIIFGNEDTNKFFEEYIVEDNREFDYTLTDHEKALKKNYDYLKILIDNYYNDNNLTDRELLNIIEQMTEKMYVIILETPNEEIANQMFETLNNTGKKLVDFYVLKNKCIKITSEELTSTFWNKIEANTDLLNKTKFLTQFASLYNGKTSDQKAYESLEKNGFLKDEKSVEDLLKKMEKVSEYFLELHQPERRNRVHDTKSDLIQYIKLVEQLKSLKAIQYRPVILAMCLKNYSLEKVNSILKICLTIQIRNIFFARQKANTLESFYPELAKKIIQSNTHIYDEILTQLNTKIISDEETIISIKNRIIKTSKENEIIRFILKDIYDYENDKEITINNDIQYVNLEHILPQNPKKNSDWHKNFSYDNETLKKYTYKLGNLTLILGRRNTDLGNKEFNEKKDLLKDSNIIQNVELSKQKKWTQKEIDSRTEILSKQILKIWPIQ
ncbi:DUF262 domain-containing protein [Staphylococcus hominis]|uniref:DUF262 domain-containing protein n=1 Tax=Staphylococcus hominis TaxID=1290 RepID=UPI0011AA49EC|nr:DUF262 domain-containing protein [Staphylococcus hominis]MCI2918764.1 DUF262 domain-containing HNH endonuclease family protein [Staphylococcus hominis]MDS3926968.1 DUF262 domain-containing HNH endonuclease family protein [Staphylococcus hominis]